MITCGTDNLFCGFGLGELLGGLLPPLLFTLLTSYLDVFSAGAFFLVARPAPAILDF